MIEAKALSKSFNDQMVLKGLTLTVSPGEIFCVLGSNGAGKTTAIHIFLGFIEPTQGKAFINGQDVSADPVGARKHVAYIPEKVALYPELTGYENLKFFTELSGRFPDHNELLGCLSDAGLSQDDIHKRAAQYSKGMQQKVGIACAVAKDADALLLDEPLAGLDPQAANEFCELLDERRDRKGAILMATHDLFRAREIGDRIGILQAGHLVEVIDAKSVSGQQLEAIYLEHMQTAAGERT
ncbi:MAG: ABC transporter ATP-binding protein [Gammaproteobacteria bacterium]|nr:ABC transporter ATP-binding protein [Gammaproteobacteria bacterium]MCY4210338.1 ABC transporter ATP-binding protein [Gammaproteobacteria bacterium]MCY4283377.1 ABC transporter ATP-binding protein [Gammaproteobacteria bacterium]MCY4339166.1 ABC transporter ATP-binding protein [Gammaproteobacteria bacterium]